MYSNRTLLYCIMLLSFCCLTASCSNEKEGGLKAEEGSTGTNPESGNCTINTSISCTCKDGSQGRQTCLDGFSYSECLCNQANPPEPEMICTINQIQICTCADGTSGERTCLDGKNYSDCRCDTKEANAGNSALDAAVSLQPNTGNSGFDASSTRRPFGDGGSVNTGTGSSTTTNPTDPGSGVTIPEQKCGPLQGMNTPPINIGGRDVLVNYPCKEKGTRVTFILNLHGTQADEGLKFYQHAYLGAFNYVTSHDLIVASPKSVVSQWGNGDGGRDRPHIMEVIDWVYQKFSDFDIASMWVAGHSWGAMYTTSFVCELNQTRGAILQSGGMTMPACADRLSVIATVGENDIVPGVPDQTMTASLHGCGAANVFDLGNNRVTEWPNCSPGWSHKNYVLLGKGHGFVPTDWPDKEVTKDIADAVKAALQ